MNQVQQLPAGGRRSRKSHRKGQTLVEFSLMLPFLFAMVFVQLDVAFAIYAEATLLQAVREGVRYGVTNPNCGTGSVKTCVQQAVVTAANGLLSGSGGNDISKISVICYAYNSAKKPSAGLDEVSSSWTSVTYNAGGNVMEVKVNAFSLPLLLPIIYFGKNGGVTNAPVTITAAAADRIEPINIAPAF
jgi:Flp pilus assembly protein TadG